MQFRRIAPDADGLWGVWAVEEHFAAGADGVPEVAARKVCGAGPRSVEGFRHEHRAVVAHEEGVVYGFFVVGEHDRVVSGGELAQAVGLLEARKGLQWG